MSAYKCKPCGTIWTNKGATQAVIPNRVPVKTCGDCATFDWPKYTKAVEYAKSLKLEPKNKKNDKRSK